MLSNQRSINERAFETIQTILHPLSDISCFPRCLTHFIQKLQRLHNYPPGILHIFFILHSILLFCLQNSLVVRGEIWKIYFRIVNASLKVSIHSTDWNGCESATNHQSTFSTSTSLLFLLLLLLFLLASFSFSVEPSFFYSIHIPFCMRACFGWSIVSTSYQFHKTCLDFWFETGFLMKGPIKVDDANESYWLIHSSTVFVCGIPQPFS